MNLPAPILSICLLLPVLAMHAPAAIAQGDGIVTAPFVTTPIDVVDRMLELASTGPSDYVVDLGSGHGRIVIAAAKKFGAKGLGLELDPKLVAQSRQNAIAAGVAARTEFREEDVLRADFSNASVVTVYLLPWLMAQLSPIFLDGLRPGARVVTHAFVFPSWKPDRVEKVKVSGSHPNQGDESSIYMWIVPAKARGLWRAQSAEGDWRIRIDQNFQEIEVEGERAGAKLAVAEARLEGTAIRFSGTARGAPFAFRGTVATDRIAGEAEFPQGAGKRLVPIVFVK